MLGNGLGVYRIGRHSVKRPHSLRKLAMKSLLWSTLHISWWSGVFLQVALGVLRGVSLLLSRVWLLSMHEFSKKVVLVSQAILKYTSFYIV